MMYCIGITGSIASGKSSVCALFAKHGISVISADHIARDLTLPDKPAFKTIVEHFGSRIVTPNGMLDRRLLRDIIFNDELERKWLEQFLHPLIRIRIVDDIAVCQSSYCLVEIPLFKHRSDYPYLNRVLAIVAPLDLRIQRIMERDHCTKQQAISIVDAQINDEKYRQLGDDIISNDGSTEKLTQHVILLHQFYLKMAQS